MIKIHCDNCERVIEVEDAQAGTKVACPDCGDINRVPEATDDSPETPRTKSGRVDKAVAAGLPPDSGPEQTVRTLRPCMFRARPLLFSGNVIVLLAGLTGVIWGLAQDRTWIWVLGAVGGVLALCVLGFWWIHTLSAALVVTNKRTIQKRGLLARSTSEVVHDNIRNIQIDQTFWQRIWGVGSIGISSSGQDGIEVQQGELKRPEEIRRIIDLYRPL